MGNKINMFEKIDFLEESHKALHSLQEKLEKLSYFYADAALSEDVPYILHQGLLQFESLVNAVVSSVFLVDEDSYEFIHELSIPEQLSETIKRELQEQINSGTFGTVINSGKPAFVATEFIGKEEGRVITLMIAPLAQKMKTIGAVLIAFEKNEGLALENSIPLLKILSSFFAISIENAHLYQDLKRSYLDTIKTITNGMEAKDPYTKGHSDRVAHLADIIAEELDWPAYEREMIAWGGMLHDIGKIGISDTLLLKPGLLTKEEFTIIEQHPAIGAGIMIGIQFLHPVIPYILEHHERYDGKGYPNGLEGEKISIKGRLLAVADTYDAMTTDRPYRQGLTPAIALSEILRCAGTQFDPDIVDGFRKAFEKGKIIGV